MGRLAFLLTTGLALLFLPGSLSHGDIYGFVSRQGTEFQLGGVPYYFVGASYFNAMNYGADPTMQAELAGDFAALRALGVTNVRIWASSEGPGGSLQLTPTLQPLPGTFNETLFSGLDYALKTAAANDLRAVLVLNNNWDWSGGMNQYVNWSPTTNKTLPNDQWGQGARHDQFYTDAYCRAAYQDFISTIINRESTAFADHRLYRDDPTIFAWELANEPRATSAGQSVLNEWLGTMAGYIKSQDPNHMVTTGSEGFFNRPWTGHWWDNPAYVGTDFIANHASVSIDYATVHIWPFNWGWYPGTDAYAQAMEFLADHVTSAENDLGKPLVLEEFGLLRDNDPAGQGVAPPGSPTANRDLFFQGYFDQLYDSASDRGPAAGSNFWTYQVDPPQEPQGLYSVYDPEDAATLAIIAAEASRMQGLMPVPGDADFNHRIDSADLAVWQRAYDPLGLNADTFPMGDWDFNGVIDSADLAVWQRNYNPLGITSQSLVPEPATLLLIGAGVLGLLRRFKR